MEMVWKKNENMEVEVKTIFVFCVVPLLFLGCERFSGKLDVSAPFMIGEKLILPGQYNAKLRLKNKALVVVLPKRSNESERRQKFKIRFKRPLNLGQEDRLEVSHEDNNSGFRIWLETSVKEETEELTTRESCRVLRLDWDGRWRWFFGNRWVSTERHLKVHLLKAQLISPYTNKEVSELEGMQKEIDHVTFIEATPCRGLFWE